MQHFRTLFVVMGREGSKGGTENVHCLANNIILQSLLFQYTST